MHNIQMYTQMGYSQAHVKEAINLSKSRQIQIFDALQMVNQQKANKTKKHYNIPSFSFLKSVHDVNLEEYQILYSKAGVRQLSANKDEIRDEFNPVGLFNVSNCCYLNSLIQCYFLMGSFVREILIAEKLPNLDFSKDNNIRKKRVLKQIELLEVLKEIFAKLKLSSKKHLDPTIILNHLVDSVGEKIEYGDEKDLHEINMCIIERLSDGLLYTKKYFTKSGQLATHSKMSSRENIKRLFYGEKIEYTSNSEETIQTDFMGLILNPKHQDLFTALDAQFNYEVEISGKFYKRSTFIKELPQYLFLNINRTQYEKNNQQLLKNSSKLAFDFVIYLDRYLEENRQKGNIMNPKIKQILLKKHKIKCQLNNLELLRTKLGECREIAQSLSGWSQRLPKDEDFEMEKLKHEKEIEKLEDELEKIQSRKEKFILMYLFVHRGDAVSGHYWGYGKNGKRWYRYDINCKEMKQNQILVDMERSSGIPYALVYARESELQNFEYPYYKKEIQQESLLDLAHDEKNNYDHYIPALLKKRIIQENKCIHQNADFHAANSIIENLLKDYKSKYNLTKAECQQAKKDTKINLPIYTNFATYLNSIKEDELMKFHLYEIALKNTAKMIPEQLMENDELLKRIQKAFKKRIKGKMALRHFAISCEPKENQKFTAMKEEYILGKKCKRFIEIVEARISKWPEVEDINQLMREGVNLILSETKKVYVKSIMNQLYGVMLISLAQKGKKINKLWLKPYEQNQIMLGQLKAYGAKIQEEQIAEKKKKYIPDIIIENEWALADLNRKNNFPNTVKATILGFEEALEVYKINSKEKKIVEPNKKEEASLI